MPGRDDAGTGRGKYRPDPRTHQTTLAADAGGFGKVGDHVILIEQFIHPKKGAAYFPQPFMARLALDASIQSCRVALDARRAITREIRPNKKGIVGIDNEKLVFKFLRSEADAIINAVVAADSYLSLRVLDDAKFTVADADGTVQEWGRKRIINLKVRRRATWAIPKLLDVASPEGEPFWTDFDALVTLRNKLQHAKPRMGDVWSTMLIGDYPPPPRLAAALIRHFDAAFVPNSLLKKLVKLPERCLG